MLSRRALVSIVTASIVLAAVIAFGMVSLAHVASQAFAVVAPYNGVLINVHNDTDFAIRLECEYTHNPVIQPGQTQLASFEPHLANSGCGVIRLSDKKTLGCVTVDPKGTGAIAGSTIDLSTHLDRKDHCYNEW